MTFVFWAIARFCLSAQREKIYLMFMAAVKLAMIAATVASPAQHQAPQMHVVQPGDTLYAISPHHDWEHTYALNQDKIKDPNMIYPGENLKMTGKAPVLAASTTAAHQTTVTQPVKATGGTYGHPYFCGDGDGDGWDIPCSKLFPHTATAPVTQRSSTASSASRVIHHAAVASSSGSYSFAGLESLWESAGGPSWAASHAARIAECESGGRTNAYNPSGATGLWQILGSVVPGNLYNAYTNALNAVSKFNASGQTFAQWVCQ